MKIDSVYSCFFLTDQGLFELAGDALDRHTARSSRLKYSIIGNICQLYSRTEGLRALCQAGVENNNVTPPFRHNKNGPEGP